ncbi:TPM domain-containing protein [Bacillus sp. ISL-47]|uniref:TPM domain-containing protein n=1 Tax=Bacillus sp. ISL-47 TaxID=2819130 RepID=UPI001BE5DD19|nr:TPM domain-containing protein [Bacillus sp. ISL-47]MBT2689320.1 TPM domain-containing protein [Bacillus sp. ISL-47]MBT2707211.1 TPM domain-containing protein [Pseudomonas sp. ISL-84]
MTIHRISSILLILLLAIGVLPAHADEHIPQPVGDIYVQDFANVLNDQEKYDLNHLGRQIEDQTSAQIAVLTVDTTGGRPIEEYTNEAFRTYGIGSAAKNNGVLLVVAMEDRQVRIEVGYGLEGRIPDGKAGRILDQYTIPNLQAGQPNRAIVETYKILAQEAAGENIVQGNGGNANAETQDTGVGIPSWLLIIIVVGFLFLDIKFFGGAFSYAILSILSRGGGGGGGGPRGGGGGSSGGGGASRGW